MEAPLEGVEIASVGMLVSAAGADAGTEAGGAEYKGDSGLPPLDIVLKYELPLPAVPEIGALHPGFHLDME
jgi:hypothetical protein